MRPLRRITSSWCRKWWNDSWPSFEIRATRAPRDEAESGVTAMCWACQESERERIWALVDIISMGEMPAGHTAEDLRALGLPQPGELYREEQPDGTILIRQVAPGKAAPKITKPTNAFVCDSPDQKN